MTNLASNLTTSAERHGAAPAIRLDDHVTSYAALDEAAGRVVALLGEHAASPGDRVAVMLPNIPAFAAIYYGILRAGAVVVPLSPLLKGREIRYHLSDSGAKVIFAWHESPDVEAARDAGTEWVAVDPRGFAERLAGYEPVRDVVERADDDTAVILYTSGTTGKPKGAELTHANLCRNAEITARTLLHLDREDVVFGGLPLFHSFGQTVALNAAVQCGASLTLVPRFDPERALQVLERDRATVFEGVPTMYAAMLNHPDHGRYDLSALRVCVSGGAAMPAEVMRAFEQTFGCTILEGYGLSETSPVASFNHPDRARKPGSIGTPIEGVQMRVVDADGSDVPQGEVGEIAIRGHNVMRGYWQRGDATREAIPDGWFRTGDMARQDEDGYFYIVDRKKDLIIRGGFNVYPREVEEVLYEHQAVAEAAVVGVPHPELGEEVGAAVALKPGATATPDELREHVKSQVAAYKYPRHVWITDALPKGPTGKILKREVSVPAHVAGQ